MKLFNITSYWPNIGHLYCMKVIFYRHYKELHISCFNFVSRATL